MRIIRRPGATVAVALSLLVVLPPPSFSAGDGRRVVGRDGRPAEELGRTDDGRPDADREQGRVEEDRSDDRARVDEDRPDEKRVTAIDEVRRDTDSAKGREADPAEADKIIDKLTDEIKAERSEAVAKSPDIAPDELKGKSRSDIRDLATEKGLTPKGDESDPDFPRKWADPVTNEQRLRLDRGHIDDTTGKPFDTPNAAEDHVHAYDSSGRPISVDGDAHIPTTGE